ncbi:uncharacterized protein TNCV_5133231 [Trichonephila clavipes]|nr:uncharacterized protein TNCV_5133231 [Trichonephila clavipes]
MIKRHRPGTLYLPGDKVRVTLHPLSNAAHKKTTKFMPKRDGPYIIVTQRSPTTYEVANPNNPQEVLGPYHSSALRPCIDKEATPVMPLRKRGRPRKDNSAGSSSRAIPRNQRGSVTNGNRVPSPGRIDKDLARVYLKGHLLGSSWDWFDIFGSALVQNTATDFEQLKAALTKNFSVVRNRKDLEIQFYSSQQSRDQVPTAFIYDMLKVHKKHGLSMSEEALVDHIFVRLEPQFQDYVEVRNPKTTAQLLEV